MSQSWRLALTGNAAHREDISFAAGEVPRVRGTRLFGTP